MRQLNLVWVLPVLVLIAFLLPLPIMAEDSLTETDYNRMYCTSIGGKAEVKHSYTTDSGVKGYVIIDCETDSEVIEGGLDKRSSLDSIQQALFFAFLTGKPPAIVIYDTDGIQGKIEYQIKQAATIIGIKHKFIQNEGSGVYPFNR